MPEIKRKPGETFEAFFRRFTKAMQQSGRLIQARKVKYLEKKPSRNLQREAALVRERLRRQREYLRKIGKLDDDERRRF